MQDLGLHLLLNSHVLHRLNATILHTNVLSVLVLRSMMIKVVESQVG